MRVFWIVSVALCVFASPLFADGDADWKREIDAARAQVKELVAHAEALQAEGKMAASLEVLKKADAIAERIQDAIAKKKKDRGSDAKAREKKSKAKARKNERSGGDVLEDLERGVRALRELGHDEAAEHMLEILHHEAEKRKRRHREQDEGADEHAAWAQRTRDMKIAVHGLMEAGSGEQAERLEHGIHAIELALEGRDDEEARHIRKTAPPLEEMLELVALGAEIWDDFGHEEKAAMLTALLREMRGVHEKREKRAPRKEASREKPAKHRADLAHQLEVHHLAMKAMAEAERPRELEVLEHAARALEMKLEGRKDEEAKQAYRNAPKKEAVVEVLRFAARLYAEWGHEERAHFCAALADQMMGEHGKEPRVKVKRRTVEDDERPRDFEARLDRLQEQVERLSRDLERILEKLDR